MNKDIDVLKGSYKMVATPELSACFQKLAFMHGLNWATPVRAPQNVERVFLCVEDGVFYYRSVFDFDSLEQEKGPRMSIVNMIEQLKNLPGKKKVPEWVLTGPWMFFGEWGYTRCELSHASKDRFCTITSAPLTRLYPFRAAALGVQERDSSPLSLSCTDFKNYDMSDIPGFYYDREKERDNG